MFWCRQSCLRFLIAQICSLFHGIGFDCHYYITGAWVPVSGCANGTALT